MEHGHHKVYPVSAEQPGIQKYVFMCPACKCGHGFIVRTDSGSPAWTFNGDLDNPTISPSILTWTQGEKPGEKTNICHSFVREGKIQFLNDCGHELKGKTVDLEIW